MAEKEDEKKHEEGEDLAKTVEKMLKEMEEKFTSMSDDVVKK